MKRLLLCFPQRFFLDPQFSPGTYGVYIHYTYAQINDRTLAGSRSAVLLHPQNSGVDRATVTLCLKLGEAVARLNQGRSIGRFGHTGTTTARKPHWLQPIFRAPKTSAMIASEGRRLAHAAVRCWWPHKILNSADWGLPGSLPRAPPRNNPMHVQHRQPESCNGIHWVS